MRQQSDRAFARLRWLLSAAWIAVLALAAIGCRSESPTAAPEEPVDDAGSLMRFVHVDDAAWLHVDVRRARANEAIAALWSDLNTDDPIAELVTSADELIIVWQDAFLQQQVAIVRGPLDRERIDEEARSGRRWSRAPMHSSLLGTTKIWKDATTERSLAMPAPNLLIAGDYDHVAASVARARAGVDEFAWQHIADAQYQVGPLHRAWLRGQLPEPTHRWVDQLEDTRASLMESEGMLKLQVRLIFRPGTDLHELIPVVAVYAELAFAVAVPELADELTDLVEIGASGDRAEPTLLLEMPIPAALIRAVGTNALPSMPMAQPTALEGSAPLATE